MWKIQRLIKYHSAGVYVLIHLSRLLHNNHGRANLQGQQWGDSIYS